MISTLPISCPDIEGVSGADGIIPISVPHIASFDAFISWKINVFKQEY